MNAIQRAILSTLLFPNEFVPFPNLQRLKLRHGFELGDNILFRGNHRTLKYLTLGLEAQLAKIPTDHCVFSTRNYKMLERVKIKIKGGLEDDIAIDKYVHIAENIGRYAKYLSYYDAEYDLRIAEPMAASLRQHLQCIERLYLEYIKFDFA